MSEVVLSPMGKIGLESGSLEHRPADPLPLQNIIADIKS
nr:MAG TPA: hypothetical protein [Caudoviricetes sp.]